MTADAKRAAHTPEPVTYFVAHDSPTPDLWFTIISTAEGMLMAARVIGEANARRIVACVNACAGINPEAVRDLLAACRTAADMLHKAINGGLRVPAAQERIGDHKRVKRDARDILRAAIARATGAEA